ncbi:spotted leaf 11 [Musa troglodytarum]|uniref:Spotted leaf 11 n=1 Tax=Musa troglodytarum TaxID=320322 RepID=A0A9E7JV13_9LILI|nr:spotted leaf 11 [Musa troglodytarum]
MMMMGSPPEFRRRMSRTYSESTDSTAPFSECRSDRTGDLDGLLVCSDDDFSDEMVRGFILDLESPSVESQLRAVMVLRFLAKSSTENRLRIARAGAVAPLVALLSHPDPQLQEHGVTAILNLSLCDENKAPIAAAGAVCHLVSALRAGTPAARENAACAIFRLAQLDDLPAILGRSGAIPPLVALLETGSLRGKKDAATALYVLLVTKDNVAPAVEAGVMHTLLDLMADPKSGMVDKAAFVLLCVLATPEGRAAAVDEGGVPVLVDMLETGGGKQKKVAMLSLRQICEESEDYRRLVVREGAIPPLVALSQSSRGCEQKAEALVELLRQPTATGVSRTRGALETTVV